VVEHEIWDLHNDKQIVVLLVMTLDKLLTGYQIWWYHNQNTTLNDVIKQLLGWEKCKVKVNIKVSLSEFKWDTDWTSCQNMKLYW
jgi:hypothetical protein